MNPRLSDFDAAHVCGASRGDASATPHTMMAHLARQAATRPDEPYLTLVSADRVQTISYGELAATSRRIGHRLGREFQVASGEVVGLVPANDLDSVFSLFGILSAGASALLLNPADPVERNRSLAAALSVKAVLRGASIAPGYMPEASLLCGAESGVEEERFDVAPAIAPASPALYFATSGSTAASKIVVQSHFNAAMNAHAVCRHHELHPGDAVLGCLPFHHVNGVHFTLFATLAAGGHAVVVERFDPQPYMDVMSRYRVRLASVVPTLLEMLLDSSVCRPVPASFDYFVSAAAPLTVHTARAVERRLQTRVLQGYGLTETTNFSTMTPWDVSSEAYRRLVSDADIPTVGTAVHGNDVAVLRGDGSHAAPGEIGELCMRGHNVMMGYAGNTEATGEAFRGGWFHSQDLGFERVDDTSGRSFFVITGRIKNIAKVGGEAVSLDEMERTLCGMPQIRDAACVASPHRLLGDELVAAVVLRDEMSMEQVRRHLGRTFAPAAFPRHVVRVERLPRTPTGKLRRPELPGQITPLVGTTAEIR
jgi:acyl-CoA synthetase (AMP-forming)/AMP-acid ligase II